MHITVLLPELGVRDEDPGRHLAHELPLRERVAIEGLELQEKLRIGGVGKELLVFDQVEIAFGQEGRIFPELGGRLEAGRLPDLLVGHVDAAAI